MDHLFLEKIFTSSVAMNNLVFCEDCAYYHSKNMEKVCWVLKEKHSPEKIILMHSDYVVLNQKNNCKYFKEATRKFFGKKFEEKILREGEEEIEHSKSYYEKKGV